MNTNHAAGGEAAQVHQNRSDTISFRRLFLTILLLYCVLTVSFYFLAGDQLRLRSSRGNTPPIEASSAAAELSEGVVVEQRFQAQIQRLESISVQFSGFYRQNSGSVTMELWRGEEQLLSERFDAASIEEGTVLTLHASAPLEGLSGQPLRVRLWSDSPSGAAAAPLMNPDYAAQGYELSVNGQPTAGTLCFQAAGTDYIWIGLHYWQLTAAFALVLCAGLLSVWRRYQSGRRSFLIVALFAMKKYRFLIEQLVARDFKLKYKRSVLGVFWSFLNPLLMMLVQYFVFSTIFHSDIPNFAAYLIIGTVMFNFFSEACSMTLTSILGNAALITKVYMPKYIYPLTRTLSSLVNLTISLVPMFIVCLVTGVQFKRSAVLALFFFACLFLFCLGLGMLLCTSMVFFRDTQFLWGVLSMMWMYATPIFYPETILSERFRLVLTLNPLYHFLKNARMCVLSGLSPEPVVYLQCLGIALLMLLVGAGVFYKNQNKFVLYL